MKGDAWRRFALHLSLHLGIPISEMLRRMTSREIAEYAALWTVEPWGEFRADLRSGIQAAATYNASGHMKHAVQPREFMPFLRESGDGQQTPEEHAAIMEAFLGG